MSPTKRPKRILIAEDNPSITQLLITQLEKEGYETIHAPDGTAAWEYLQQEELPDLVLLDILMPKMNGLEVCRLIRSHPRMTTIPVVFLTALQDSSSRLEGLEAGANDFLGKPWSKAELHARIRTLLRLKEAQDALRQQHRRLSLLYDMSRELSAYLDLDQMLSLMLARSAYSLEASRGSIVLLDNRGPKRKIQMGESLEPKIMTPPTMDAIEQKAASWLFKFRRPLLVTDTADKTEFQDWDSIRSLLVAPFLFKQQIQGFILFSHPEPNQFDSEHLDLLDSIARQTTITIENARLFERVQEERQRFAVLISSMDDGVIATDQEQKIILANPASVHLLECEEKDLKGKPVTDAVRDKTLRSLFTGVAAQQRSLTSEIDWDDGKALYATVSPVGGGGQVAVIQDISPLKELQAMQLEAEQEKTARIRATFDRYMSPELVSRALSEELGLMERRERREAAVLFADLRGFTRLTARFSPDDVVAILNEYFSMMTKVAYSHDGTIFDLAGDELMVGFGVPFELDDPVAAAIQAGIEMQTVMTTLSEKSEEVFSDRRLGMGIGVDYGEVIVGNVGSPTRMNYALVGLPVNTAHGLVETAADGEIRFSEDVMARLHALDLDYPIVTIKGIQLKGHDRAKTIYSMVVDRSRRT